MLYQESVSQHFLSQSRSAPQYETGLSFDKCHQPPSASELVRFTLIKLQDPNIRISVGHSGGGGACWDTDLAWIMMEHLGKIWKSLVPAKLRAYVRDYCKRNGLLTLSVIAVVTGCVLGFLLRSLNLSTQVRINESIGADQEAIWLALNHTALNHITLRKCSGFLNIVCELTQPSGWQVTVAFKLSYSRVNIERWSETLM